MAGIKELFAMQQARQAGKEIDVKKYEAAVERLKPRQFWDTQPVPKLSEDYDSSKHAGPIEI